MNEEQYIKERVDSHIKWYNQKAAMNKRYHYMSKIIVMILSSVIPIITLVQYDIKVKDIFLAILGAVIAIITGITGLMSYQEKWTEYRNAAEELLHQKAIFLTKTSEYKDLDFDYFVSTVEGILKGERATWLVHTNSA